MLTVLVAIASGRQCHDIIYPNRRRAWSLYSRWLWWRAMLSVHAVSCTSSRALRRIRPDQMVSFFSTFILNIIEAVTLCRVPVDASAPAVV